MTGATTPEIYTLSLHDALPISKLLPGSERQPCCSLDRFRSPIPPFLPFGLSSRWAGRSEEHTSELQSLRHLVCRLLLEKKKNHYHINVNDRRANIASMRRKVGD